MVPWQKELEIEEKLVIIFQLQVFIAFINFYLQRSE